MFKMEWKVFFLPHQKLQNIFHCASWKFSLVQNIKKITKMINRMWENVSFDNIIQGYLLFLAS